MTGSPVTRGFTPEHSAHPRELWSLIEHRLSTRPKGSTLPSELHVAPALRTRLRLLVAKVWLKRSVPLAFSGLSRVSARGNGLLGPPPVYGDRPRGMLRRDKRRSGKVGGAEEHAWMAHPPTLFPVVPFGVVRPEDFNTGGKSESPTIQSNPPRVWADGGQTNSTRPAQTRTVSDNRLNLFGISGGRTRT